MIRKFRVWDKRNKVMITESEISNDGEIGLKDYCLMNGQRPSDFSFMQHTGLKDKKGNEIFEGDIVKTDADYKTKFIIVWCNEGNMMAGFCGKNIRAEGKPRTDYYLAKGKHIEIQYLCPMEVIGNIHENPELMREVEA